MGFSSSSFSFLIVALDGTPGDTKRALFLAILLQRAVESRQKNMLCMLRQVLSYAFRQVGDLLIGHVVSLKVDLAFPANQERITVKRDASDPGQEDMARMNLERISLPG